MWGVISLTGGFLIALTVGYQVMMGSFKLGAAIYHFLVKKCRLPSALVFPLVWLPTMVVFMLGFSMMALPPPAKMMDSAWVTAPDGLDALTLLNTKAALVSVYACCAALWFAGTSS